MNTIKSKSWLVMIEATYLAALCGLVIWAVTALVA